MPRKTAGCWTCRARKKKCDEARPSCSSCRLRAIICYGYDAKPTWMDGGVAEQEMLSTFKRQCKEAYRARRSTMTRPSQSHQVSSLEGPLRKLAPRQDSDGNASSSISHAPSAADTPSSAKENRFSYTEREINLVMYY